MLTQKKVLTFNREKNNRWYVESKEWEELQTKHFRKTHTYEDEEGKTQYYNEEQDFSNPLDDHTKHPAWRDPHEDLVMDDSFEALLQKMAAGARQVKMEVISYGWVSNTYTHYYRSGYDENGANYELRFKADLPAHIRLTPICLFLFDGYPEHFHGKSIK